MSNKPPPPLPPPSPPHPPRKQPPPPPPLFSPLTPPHPLNKPPPSPPPPPHPPNPPPSPPPPPPPVQPPPPSTGDNKTYRDCIQGICSLNCPQFCTFLPFPPPPPFFLYSATSSDSNKISPLIASLIAVLAAAFLLLFYYTVVSRYLLRRRRRHLSSSASSEIRLDPLVQDPARPAGLDGTFIRQITVFRYRRGDGLVEGTECAVCLSEFAENECLRLMPNCEHAFHIPCIDTWLQSNSSCPLCRSGMDPVDPVRTDPGRTGGVNLAHMRVERSGGGGGDDTVLVVREVEGEGEVIVCHEIVDVRDNGEIKSYPSPLLN